MEDFFERGRATRFCAQCTRCDCLMFRFEDWVYVEPIK